MIKKPCLKKHPNVMLTFVAVTADPHLHPLPWTVPSCSLESPNHAGTHTHK